MELDDVIHKAHDAGSTIGQIAIAEYILKTYPNDLNPELTKFLQSVLKKNYDKAAEQMGEPVEDVALKFERIMKKLS